MVVEIEGRAEGILYFLGKRGGRRGRLLGQLQHDELVSADARDHLDALEPPAQALRDALQERVSNRGAERVVDLLKAIDVEEEHDQRGTPTRVALERLLDALAQKHTVRQVGERVMAGHV